MNKAKMIEWIASHNVCISSKTMWCSLMGVKCNRDDVPYDADDFSRCHDLYKFAELTQEDLQKIADTYPYWQPVIDRWNDLCAYYERKDYSAFRIILDGLNDRIMKLKGFRKVREGFWEKGTRNDTDNGRQRK